MNESAAWAKGIRIANRLLHRGSQTAAPSEPRLAVQTVTRNVVLCDAPRESFSDKTPVFIPSEPAEDRWRPIDILYGSYDPAGRSIDIYIDRIRSDAQLFGEFDDVLQIVRLHEYAHAVVHLGIRFDQTIGVLDEIGPTGGTDWSTFLVERRASFAQIDDGSNEFLAQAITVAAVKQILDRHKSERLMATFDALEGRQPPHYVLPSDIKAAAHLVDWSLVIAAARREIDVFRGSAFLCPRASWLWLGTLH